MLSLGIVGLPNVGKSTLFNALTRLQAHVANYPFATIEPNLGVVPVPDERLQKLAKLENSAQIIPTAIEFRDIAGLVKGAHQGEGLGNEFLSHIREVDAIVEVVREFDDPNVIHVEGKIDPRRDMETIETELILADLGLVEKKMENLKSAAKSGRKEDLLKLALAQKYHESLAAGKLANSVSPTNEEKQYLHEFPLLTRKPILYVRNSKSNFPPREEGRGEVNPLSISPSRGGEIVILDCLLEAEIAQLSETESGAYLKELGLPESGLTKLIKAAYQLLNLITFFTAGPKETRAWTCQNGAKAPQAAGIIHTDFELGFIKAEVINWQKLLEAEGWSKARELGSLRQEGKDYVIQDGDVVHFRFNV